MQKKKIVGVFNDEGPPVPIPNTEVKLISADNTCLATDWKDRSMPTPASEKEAGFLFVYPQTDSTKKPADFRSLPVLQD